MEDINIRELAETVYSRFFKSANIDCKEFFEAGMFTAIAAMRRLLADMKENQSVKTKEQLENELEWILLEWTNEYTHELEGKEKEDL